jgi:hypothetical protein
MILLLVKVYAVYFLSKMIIISETPNKSNYMFVFKPLGVSLFAFNVLFVIMEAYYLFGFFTNLEFIAYESLAMLDQITMTISVLYILKKRKQ